MGRIYLMFFCLFASQALLSPTQLMVNKTVINDQAVAARKAIYEGIYVYVWALYVCM
jgi:hypothetical protein